MASDKVIEKKKAVVKEIEDTIENNNTLILFNYRGLSDSECKAIRRELRENNDDYKVYKNTLMRRAFENKNIDLDEHLVGPSAIAFGEDQLTAIKTLSKFAKKNKNLEIKVGYINDKIVELDTLKELALVPSREELLTRLAHGIITPVKKLGQAIKLIAEKKEEESK